MLHEIDQDVIHLGGQRDGTTGTAEFACLRIKFIRAERIEHEPFQPTHVDFVARLWYGQRTVENLSQPYLLSINNAMSDATFRDFVLDQLHRLGELECRRMFGSYGLYHDGVFFGIICQGQLYLKTDSVTQTVYRQRGMQPFRPHTRQTLRSYYAVPIDILEDPEQLAVWAQQAIACQTAASTAQRTRRRAR